MEITLAGGAVTYEPNDDQLGRVSLEFAALDGEVGVGQLPVPDSTAALTVADGRSARVDEIATRLTDGFIIDQDRVRGPQPAATAREHSYSVQDANALLDGFRIARSRSSETDYARVIAFAAADGPSWDTTWVLNTNTVTMPAKAYYSDGGWTSELIPDVVEFTGKTLFLHDKSGGGRCLHYHNLTSGHTSGLTISDVPSAVNGVTVFAPGQPTRNRTSVDLWNSVKGVDQANRTYITSDSTSIATHDADGLQHEVQLSVEASSYDDLQVKTAAYLASFKDERDTWTCIIGPLDATALSLIRVGDLITTTSSVMGLTASPQRVAHMTLSVWTGADGPPAPGLWQAALELGAPIRRRARVRNKSTTDRAQHPPIDGNSTGGCQSLSGTDWVDEQIGLDGMDETHVNARIVIIPLNDDTITDGTSQAQGHLGAVRVSRALTTSVPYDGSNVVHVRGRFHWPVISTDSVNGPWAYEPPAIGSLLDNGEVAWDLLIDITPSAGGLLIEAGATQAGGITGLMSCNGDTASFSGINAGGWYNFHIRLDATDIKASVWSGGAEPVAFMLVSTLIGTDMEGVEFEGQVLQTGTNGSYPNYAPPPPPLLVESEYVFDLQGVTVCSGDELQLAYRGSTYGPVYIGTAPALTKTYTLWDYPPDPIAGVRAFINGVYEPSTYNAATRQFTFANSPVTGDTIDVEIELL
jgi:hypothetical protein